MRNHKPKIVCSKCNKEFTTHQTPKEALLSAIFSRLLCQKCQEKEQLDSYPKCTVCKEPIIQPIYYNDQPYCNQCIDTVTR